MTAAATMQEPTQYITELDVSLDAADETSLRAKGFNQIPVDLNQGTAGDKTYLWYKKGNEPPITRIQTSFTDDVANGLNSTGYQKIPKNLNAGAGGDSIYLWSYTGSTEYDVPIVELLVSTEPEEEAQLLRLGWERVIWNLNRHAGGKFIYLWVKRAQPTYICDITATSGFDGVAKLFGEGYIPVFPETNKGAGGSSVFIWYLKTTNTQRAITDLQVSVNYDESDKFKKQGYTPVPQDLNEGTGGNKVLLWYKNDDPSGEPIKSIIVITDLIGDKEILKPYKMVGATVIGKNLNEGNSGVHEYLCFNQ